jgi:hypothetical protein
MSILARSSGFRQTNVASQSFSGKVAPEFGDEPKLFSGTAKRVYRLA